MILPNKKADVRVHCGLQGCLTAAYPQIRVVQRGPDSPEFGQTFQPTNERIAGLGLSALIVQDVLPVVWPQGD